MNTQISINRDKARWFALGIGLVALIVGILTLIVGPLNTTEVANTYRTVSYVAFGVAVIGLVGFVLLDPETLISAITGRSGQYSLTSWVMAIFFIAMIVFVYGLLRRAAIQPLDLTESQKFQMSDTTRETLQSLSENVQVTGFFSEGDPSISDAELWMKQYSGVSGGKISYQVVDPDKNPGLAKQLGMSRSGSIIFKRGDQTSEATSATEEELTNALIHVLSGEKRKAYVLIGDGERSVADFQETGISQFEQLLTNANFEVAELNLIETKTIPDDANVLIIAGPSNNLLDEEVTAINAYQDKGGGVLVMFDALQLTNDDPYITNIKDRWGITLHDDLVVDILTQQVVDAFSPMIFNFDDISPITEGFNTGGRRVIISTARSIEAAQLPPANVTITGLMSTSGSGQSWGETHYEEETQAGQIKPDDADFPGPLTVAMSAEDAATNSRIVVVGDSDIAANFFLQGDKYNGEILLNAVNWLSHKEDLISLPTAEDIGTRTFTKIGPGVATLLAIFGACLLPLGMLVTGIIVWVVRRRRR